MTTPYVGNQGHWGTILHYALQWFEAHDEEHPICTCGSLDPSTLCTATHDVGCPVHAFTKRGWEYGVDRYQEMLADVNDV